MLEEKKKTFCKKCGLKIAQQDTGGFKNPFGNPPEKTSYEFEDGTYCKTCATEKVTKARGKK